MQCLQYVIVVPGGSTLSPNGLTIVINLTRDDLNRIKLIEDLLIDEYTSYLSVEPALIQDMNRNFVTALPPTGPLQISTYVNDTTRPEIVTFGLDMNEGILALYFLETVDIQSVNYSCISLLSGFDGRVSYTLTGGRLLALRDPTLFSGNGLRESIENISGSGSGTNSSGMSGSGESGSGGGEGASHQVYVPLYWPTMNVDEFIVLSDSNAMMDATAIFVNFTLDDLNAIKAAHIGQDIMSSWLAVEPCAIKDQNGLLLQPLEAGVNALEVQFHVNDTTPPRLQQFDLDMNAGVLTFRFTETVNGQLLDLSQLTFHSVMYFSLCNSSYPCEEHTLILDFYLPVDDIAPEINATIGELDLNELQRLRELATSQHTTYISFTSSLVHDTSGNMVVGVPPSAALQVTRYTRDRTRPKLVSFDLDLDSDLLTLTFDETVDGATLDVTQLTFQQFDVLLEGDQFYQLVGSPHDEFSSTVLQVNLSYTDRNALKQLNTLATKKRNTWISITDYLVNDTDSNRIESLPALLVRQFTSDDTEPTLLNYTLNLTSEVLSLSFSETVDVSTLDVTDILIQNDTTLYSEHSYRLRAGLFDEEDTAVVHIALSFDDVTELKKDRSLATTENNTFISFSMFLVSDTTENRIVPIPNNNALQADLVISDSISPVLNDFDLDLTLGKLYLYFSETVDPYSLNLDQIQLQNNISVVIHSMLDMGGSASASGSGSADAVESGSGSSSGSDSGTGSGIGVNTSDSEPFDYSGAYYTLSQSTFTMEYSPTITITLSDHDLNNIKQFFNLATSMENTYISFPNTLIIDTSYNPIVPISHSNAKQVRVFTADAVPPVLLNFSLSFDSDTIVFTFSEAVNVNSFNLSMVFIRGTSLYPSTRLSQPLQISGDNGTIISVKLTSGDLNNLKRQQTIATNGESTLLFFHEPVVFDMMGNAVETIARSSPLPVATFGPDTRPPILVAFDINLNSGHLALVFNETVNRLSLKTTYITLQATENITHLSDIDFQAHTLAVSDTIERTDEPSLTVIFTTSDFNEIKRKDLCRYNTSCYLSFLDDTVRDMDNRPISGVSPFNAYRVRNFVSDLTPPDLVQFLEIDLNNGTIVLEFSETVNINSFNYTGISFQNFFRMPRHSLTLSGGESLSENGTIVTISLLPQDHYRLLQDDNICSDINNCWITVDENSVSDMNGNGNFPVPVDDAIDSLVFRDDITSPYLEDFSLDMDSAILTLTFNEPVRGSTLDITQLSLQPSANSTILVTLLDSTTSSVNSHIVVIQLSLSDYNLIRRTEFAKTENDTYLSLTDSSIFDIAVTNANPVIPIPSYAAKRVANYTADTTQPFLLDFQLDLTSEALLLTFSEPVRPSTFDVEEVTLVSSRSTPPLSLSALTSGYVAGETAFDGTEVVQLVLNRRANEYSKLDLYFGRFENATLISIGPATIADMAWNYNVPIAIENATEVSMILPDTLQAELEQFTIDFDQGLLHLIFTDIVIPSSLRARAVQLQDATTATTSVQLTDDSTTVSPEGYTVSIKFSTEDINAITYDINLATSINNTFLVFSSDVVKDLQLRTVIPVIDDFGIQASDYIYDNSPPQLDSFVLDVNSGEIIISFSETVRTSTLNVSGIVLQSTPMHYLSKGNFVRLTNTEEFPGGSYSFSDNGSSIVVQLGSLDLNEIKRLTNLGTEPNNTFMSIDNDTIVDMVGNYNTETTSQAAIKATDVVSDGSEPELESFTFNLTEGQIYLTFSETVDSSTLNVDSILVQNASNTYLDRVMLQHSRGSVTESPDSTIVIVMVGRDDLNDIKRNRRLGTSTNNTFLFLNDDVIDDMNGNPNVPIYNPFALQASDVYPDEARPYLLNFTLDLNLGWLILTFDETVETASLMVDQITLQNTNNAYYSDSLASTSGSGSSMIVSGDNFTSSGSGIDSGSGELIVIDIDIQSRRLTAGELPLESRTFSDDNPVVVIVLGENDLNEIKRLPNLATTELNTYLAITSEAVVDMNNNSIVAIEQRNATMAERVILDENPPYLRDFHLDMDKGQLILTFNETVNASSLDPSKIVMQSFQSAPPPLQHNIQSGVVLTSDSTIVVLEISTDDLNEIKKIPDLATSVQNTYVRFLDSGVYDMFGNPIRQVESRNALMAGNFTEDKTSPMLLEFDLDMNTAELTLTFDETVNTSSLRVEGIILLGFNSSLSGDYYMLTNTSVTLDPFSPIVTILLSREDSNEIKRLPELAVDAASTYISIQSFTIKDMNGNEVIPISQFNASQVRNYTVDVNRPIVIAFHLNLDSNQLILTFDETVSSDSIVFEKITVHSQSEIATSTYMVTLTGDYVVNDNSHILYIQLKLNEVNEIKLHENFGTLPSNFYITTSDGALNDVSTNANPLIGNTLNASHIVPDRTSPVLDVFSVDLNSGMLILIFNEPVNTSTFEAPGLTLQNSVRSRIGLRLSTSYTTSGNGQTVIVTLSNDDLNEIKRIDSLFIDEPTSYVTISPQLIEDMMGNPVRSIVNGFALQTSGYLPDLGLPSILSYQLDMDEGYVTLFFSETVNVSSLQCEEITFSSSINCSVWYTLNECVVDTANVTYTSNDVGTSGSGSGDYGSAPNWTTPYHYSTYVSFFLSLRDLNQLKALEIAPSAQFTYLSYTNQTVMDQSDISLMERGCFGTALPILSSDFIADTTRPEIHSFNLSLNTEEIVISFSETVRSETLMIHLISLQNEESSQLVSQNHTTGVDVNTRTYDGPTDILTIMLGRDDLNIIKSLTELAVSNITTYLTADSYAIRDMKGLNLVSINASSALQVNHFTPDEIPPLLTNYVLDLNLGCLHLTFVETMNISTLNYSGLILQVLPDITVFDNMTGNTSRTANESRVSGSGSGVPINITEYESCGILYFRLTGGVTLTRTNDPEVSFNFTWDDLNDIKRETCLGTSVSNTYLSIDMETILDMNDNAIDEVDQESSIMALQVIPDNTPPNLDAFDLNMTAEILTLYFDETVNVDTFDPRQITLYSSPLQLTLEVFNLTGLNGSNTSTEYFYSYSSEVNYTLQGGMVLGGDDPVVELKLDIVDLNNIKAIVEVATEPGDTFISITNETVYDMNRNEVNAISPEQAIRVSNFTTDNISPELVSFDLNLNDSLLHLTFDETVNVSSLVLSEVTILSSNSSLPAEEWTLSGGDPPEYSYSDSADGPVIIVQLGTFDTNELKRLKSLAISNSTTFISLTSQAILDMAGNSVQEITYGMALQVSEYTEDEISPVLIDFDLDLNTGNLTLVFDETVNASSVIVSDLLLQNDSFPLSSLAIYNSSVIPNDDPILYIEFGIDFLNHLKRVDDLATSFHNTFLSFPTTALTDMNGNSVVFISNISARGVRNYTNDTTNPVLLDFDLDMDEGQLVFSFSETIRVSTLQLSEVVLSEFPYYMPMLDTASGSIMGMGSAVSGSGSGSGFDSSGHRVSLDSYKLTSGYVQTSDSHIVLVNITLYDLNEIKKLRNLATSEENTYILFRSELLDDMYSNPIIALLDDEGKRVSNFTNDTTQPDIVWYHLDMNSDMLTISFTETVDLLTLVIDSRIIFYNTSDFNGESYALSDSTSPSPDGPLVKISLSAKDSNQLKFLRSLANTNETTYLYLNNTIFDMVGNVITTLYNGSDMPRPANMYTTDGVQPTLVEFDFDLNLGLLHLTFSEVVDEIHVPSFTVINDAVPSNTTQSVTLSGAKTVYGPSLLPNGPGHPPELTIALTDDDLNEIKRLDHLAVSNETTFIAVLETGAMDAFNNPLMSELLSVTQWTDDSMWPQLVEFSFSANTGILGLTFDETVRLSTFNATSITFVNTETGTSYSVQHHPPSEGASVTENDSTVIELTLANDDLNDIKILQDLAVSNTTTFIMLEVYTVEDMRGNPLNISNLPLRVTVYEDDITRPELTAFDVDLDNGLLTLFFSETVNASTLNIEEITLQPWEEETTPMFSHMLAFVGPPPEGSFTNTTDGPIMKVYIGDYDLNEVKRIPELATLPNNTFISISNWLWQIWLA